MFYCRPCGDARGWGVGLLKSVGPCEICGARAACSDVPSRDLPIPRAVVKPDYDGLPDLEAALFNYDQAALCPG